MKCSDIERFLEAYLDDEFDARDHAEFDAHLGDCEVCRERVEMERGFRAYFRKQIDDPEAPVSLRAKILAALDEEQDEVHEHVPPSTPETQQSQWRAWQGWRYISISAAAAVLLGLTVAGVSVDSTAQGSQLTGHLGQVIEPHTTTTGDDEVVEETLDWHRRRLPVEVTGPHGEDVRSWFRGKVDFPVNIPRFAGANVALLGGRIAKVGDHKAALLTLEVEQRKLSVLAFPLPAQRPHHLIPATHRVRPGIVMRKASGYNVAILRDGDMTYSFVSDIPQQELRQLVRRVNLR